MSSEPKGEVTVAELSRAQQALGRRAAQSRATVPDLTLAVDVDMDAVLGLLEDGADAATDREAAPILQAVVVRACALALREHPRANGSYRDAQVELHGRVNVGVVLAAEDSSVTPTIFDADTKSPREIAEETRALGERASVGAITAGELAGATFTVAALAVDSFSAVLTVPQAATLAIGAVRAAPVVRGGGVRAGHLMTATLSCDNRVLDGAAAAAFLARVRELLEEPAGLGLSPRDP